MALQVGLLVLFLWCGLVYGRASKELVRLDKIRLEQEPPTAPESVLGAATEFARKFGITLAPGSKDLEAFCARNGLSDEYKRASRRLYGAIMIALMCAYFIIRLSPGKSVVP